MNSLIGYILVAWIPLAILIFALTKCSVRGILLVYLLGWLLLPVGTIETKGFWEMNKAVATNLAITLAVIGFTPGLLRQYRPHVADLLLLVFCAGGFATSLNNDLGVKDGLNQAAVAFFQYGTPYFVGRLFLTRREDFHQACRTMVLASSLYAVLAIYEWRMSPLLHVQVYGVFQHSWSQHIRWGFWRPIVFFEHGLALGAFFAWTSILAICLYRTGDLTARYGPPASKLLLALVLTGLLACMSFSPWGLFVLGIGLLGAWLLTGWRIVPWVPMLLAFGWMYMRYVPLSDGTWLISSVQTVSEDRAESLQFRVEAENLLIEHGKQRPIYGWGTWGRNRVYNEDGRDMAITDSLWIILFGTCGLLGLVSFFLWWCCPLIMCVWRRTHEACGLMEQAVIISIGVQAINLVFNGFVDPLLTLLMGSIISLLQHAPRVAQAPLAPRVIPARRLRPTFVGDTEFPA